MNIKTDENDTKSVNWKLNLFVLHVYTLTYDKDITLFILRIDLFDADDNFAQGLCLW